jgi:uncharacterized membrane protein YfcA
MIFLPSLMLYSEANLLSSILSTLVSLCLAAVAWRNISFKNLIFPLIGSSASIVAAVFFSKQQDDGVMMLCLGVALFALSLYFFFFSGKIKIRPTWYAGLIAGVLSGIMNGMFSIGGPPVVIYFMQSEETPEDYASTISAFFFLSGILSVGSKAAAGFFTPTVWICLAVCLIGMLAGSFLGKKTRDGISPELIKKTVYGFMALSGLANIVTSLI